MGVGIDQKKCIHFQCFIILIIYISQNDRIVVAGIRVFNMLSAF